LKGERPVDARGGAQRQETRVARYKYMCKKKKKSALEFSKPQRRTEKRNRRSN